MKSDFIDKISLHKELHYKYDRNHARTFEFLEFIICIGKLCDHGKLFKIKHLYNNVCI